MGKTPGGWSLWAKKGRTKAPFSLSSQLEVIIRFESDPVTPWPRPLGLGKLQLWAYKNPQEITSCVRSSRFASLDSL